MSLVPDPALRFVAVGEGAVGVLLLSASKRLESSLAAVGCAGAVRLVGDSEAAAPEGSLSKPADCAHAPKLNKLKAAVAPANAARETKPLRVKLREKFFIVRDPF